jgi:hypothetical protein
VQGNATTDSADSQEKKWLDNRGGVISKLPRPQLSGRYAIAAFRVSQRPARAAKDVGPVNERIERAIDIRNIRA